MAIIAYILSFLCLALNATLFVRLKPPNNFYFVVPQIVAVVLSPFLALFALVGAGLGWLYHAPIAVVAGLMSAGISVIYIALVTISHQRGFDLAFGKDWRHKISSVQESRLLKRRWNIKLSQTGEPKWEPDVPFWMIPDTGRKLLCDLWQPPENVTHSGLALIYLHGGGWWVFDKDFCTRPFFHQLTAQGHVIMDVSYRLCPEVDIFGMIGDVKRAVVWMKTNAARYQVNPERIVLGGASSGGHLALLAAFAPTHPLLTPLDIKDCDLSVQAAVSYYGPTDLRACYEHTNQKRLMYRPKVEIGLPGSDTMEKNVARAGRLDTLLGGHPHEIPEVYELASPVAHVHPGCPPTLLIQGEPDVITPIAATKELHRRLVDCGVSAINIVYPFTNHAFDMLWPQVSPPTHASLYDLERFLALMV